MTSTRSAGRLGRGRTLVLGLFWVVAVGVGALASPQVGRNQPNLTTDLESLARDFGGEAVYTKPGQDATIGFQLSTQVREISVQGGQRVRAGDLLVRGDDAEERALMRAQEVRAKSDIPMRRAIEQHELAKVELERLKEAAASGAANEQEIRRAEVTAIIAGIDVEQARWNGEQEALSLERFKERVERYSLRAPFDGLVESIAVDVGDTLREGDPVARVVSIDPLIIDVNTPIAMAIELEVGGPAWVLVGVPGAPVVKRGEISEISPVAEFASRTRRVRVEMGNPDLLPAGLAAWVRFSQPDPRFMSLGGG